MFYNILPATLGPVGWALAGVATGATLVKVLSDSGGDCDRTVTVVQSPPQPKAKRGKRKRAKEQARVAERLCLTLAKVDSRLDVMQSQIDDLAKREPRHPEPSDA